MNARSFTDRQQEPRSCERWAFFVLALLSVAAMQAGAAEGGVMVIAEQIVVEVPPGGPAWSGYLDVYVQVTGGPFTLGTYDLRLALEEPTQGIRFTGASATSGAHPPLPSVLGPNLVGAPGRMLTVADRVHAVLLDGHGLVRAHLTVPPDAGGTFPVRIAPEFTNLVGSDGRAIPIDGLVDGRIVIQSTVLADVDSDGKVGLFDFSVIKRNFGKPGGRAEGDVDGDGMVALADWQRLKQSFGRGYGAASGAHLVTEPAAGMLALVLWSITIPAALQRPALAWNRRQRRTRG